MGGRRRNDLRTTTGGQAGPIAISSASLAPVLSAGSLASMRGLALTGLTEGLTVRIRDAAGDERTASPFAVAADRLDFVVPSGPGLGSATIDVLRDGAPIATAQARIERVAPGLFVDGEQSAVAYAARQEPDRRQTVLPAGAPIVLDDRPVDLVLFGSGIRNRTAFENVRCTVRGIAALVEYAGPGGATPGLDQVNIRLTPAMKGAGRARVALTVDGVAANPVFIDLPTDGGNR